MKSSVSLLAYLHKFRVSTGTRRTTVTKTGSCKCYVMSSCKQQNQSPCLHPQTERFILHICEESSLEKVGPRIQYIGCTSTFLYFDLYFNTAYAAQPVYYTVEKIILILSILVQKLQVVFFTVYSRVSGNVRLYILRAELLKVRVRLMHCALVFLFTYRIF